MPKRKRTDDVSNEAQAHPEPVNTIQSSDEGSAAVSPGLVEGPSTLGSPAATVGTKRAEDAQPLDEAAAALLAAHPFWGLLLEAGYTWC